jgi:large repetitive protein
VYIHLLPLGIILPPAQTPTASFTFAPIAPTANIPVQFDASASCGSGSGGCSSGSIVSYEWDFGDGAGATGRLSSHAYSSARTYSVTLTVTNDRGVKASTTKQVTIGGGASPTAVFVFSPTPVTVGTEIYFDASGSRAAAGHTIANYSWNWGDGDAVVTSSSPLQDHDFQSVGKFTVVLTVTDETGQPGTATQVVDVVGAAGATADFIFTIQNPATHTAAFDATAAAPSAGATIVSYDWLFGDGTSGSGKTVSHSYPDPGPTPKDWDVKLTVTDSKGKTAVVSKAVKVP